MEGLKYATPFANLVSESLADTQFTLLDIGCSSGIDPVWRLFGNRLRAFAFDPNVNEIARLREQETLAGVTYIPAYVGFADGDVGAMQLRTQDYWARNPWARLSVARTLAIRADDLAATDDVERTRLNLWKQVPLANPDDAVVIPSFLRQREIHDVDFVKIDVDGPDFLILRSLSHTLEERNVLGVGIEVNFFGSDDPEIHTFHNVDRLMKKLGFELFSLSTRSYSVATLPAPYQYSVPAQTLWGRPLQGDAIYLRDAAAPEHERWALASSPLKLAKLAALFSVIGLPDCAAETLLHFRIRIAEQLDIERGLELLTAQSIPAGDNAPSFAQYVAEFEADTSRFYNILDERVESDSEPCDARTQSPSASNRPAADVAQPLSPATVGGEQPTQEKLTRLEQEIASLRSSTSWRLTAPLRAVVDTLKQFSRGAL